MQVWVSGRGERDRALFEREDSRWMLWTRLEWSSYFHVRTWGIGTDLTMEDGSRCYCVPLDDVAARVAFEELNRLFTEG